MSKYPITTTSQKIFDMYPLDVDWFRLLNALGKKTADTEALPLTDVLRINGARMALYVSSTSPQTYARDFRLMGVWYGRQHQHLMRNEESRNALDVAERYANGRATNIELAEAAEAAGEILQDTYRYGLANTGAWLAELVLRPNGCAVAYDIFNILHPDETSFCEMFTVVCNGTAPWQKGTKS